MTIAHIRSVAAAPEAALLAGCRLHPCHILRIAGEPAAALNGIGTGEADTVWVRSQALRAEIAAAGPAACAYLEAMVPQLGDQAALRAALNIKRAIYKGKGFAPALLDDLAGRIDADEAAILARLAAALAEVAGLDAELLAAHGRELAAGSDVVAGLLSARNMLSGLSYANPDFLQKLTRHFDPARAGRADAKTVRNVEDSLLQYHARSSTKTSPLSSFTVIHVGQWQNDGDTRPWQVDHAPALQRRVEFKAGLMRHLVAPLLGDFGVVAPAFALARNPSVSRADGRIKIYGIAAGQEATGRTWGTGLTVSQLDANAVIACIDHVLANGAMPAAALVAGVCALAPKLSPAAVWPFVQRLFAMGYLVAETGFVEQHHVIDWALSLCDNPGFAAGPLLRPGLDRIAASLAVMGGDDAAARADAVIAINREIHALADITGADHTSPHFKPAFYENCYLPDAGIGLDRGYLARFEPELAVLHDLSFLLDPNQELHARMCDFFVARFGADGCCDDVIGFLEAFDAVYAPGVLDGRIDAERVAANSPQTEAWLRAKAAFDALVEPYLDGSADIDLDLDAVAGVIALLPPGQRARSASYSYVVQTAGAGDDARLVLNQVFGGRSAILSRFLEGLDDDRLEAVRDYVAAGANGGRSAEIGGVFGFNANRHPALSRAEVEIPPFPRAFAGLETLRLDMLTLDYDAVGHRLVFRTADGAAIDIWYHGLLIPSLLPQLHRVLGLAFTEGPSLAITKALALRGMAGGRAASHVPRINLGGIVLFRRTWMIAAAELPDATLPAADFYAATRRWQAAHGLPDRAFVRALPLPDARRADGGIAWENVNFKDMKPFYVDLRSPRFVRLMQNMFKRSAMAVSVSELLPDFDSHPTRIAGATHVAELHFELTRTAVAPVAAAAWFTIRIGYFDTDRRALMTGPIAAAIDVARREFGVETMFVAPHWKYGPHVDLNIHADAATFLLRLYPRIAAIIGDWLAAHPSATAIDPEAYAELSRGIGMFELDRGPYLPLLRNNSVTQVPYRRSRALVHPALAASRETLLADSLDIVMALYRLKASDPDAVFLALHAMLAAVADTWVGGMQDGFMSLRSHADYFFAAHDVGGGVRARFDGVDAKRRGEIDAITGAIAAGEAPPLAPEIAALVMQWRRVIAATDVRNHAVVAANLSALVEQTVHMDLAMAMQGETVGALRDAIVGRKNSEIGEIFLNTPGGQAAQRAPEFIAYRSNVNFFYALLPIVEIAPLQKFLLCHLTANSIERVFGQDWRGKINLVAAE